MIGSNGDELLFTVEDEALVMLPPVLMITGAAFVAMPDSLSVDPAFDGTLRR